MTLEREIDLENQQIKTVTNERAWKEINKNSKDVRSSVHNIFVTWRRTNKIYYTAVNKRTNEDDSCSCLQSLYNALDVNALYIIQRYNDDVLQAKHSSSPEVGSVWGHAVRMGVW